LTVLVQTSFVESRRNYGSPRVHDDLIALQERVSRKRDSVVVGQSPTCGGDGTSDNKTLPEYPRDPHAMQGAACCMRVWCLDAAGRACGAGPAAAETAAGLAGMHCRMRKRLRLMRCVLRTVRNDALPRTFRALAGLDYRDTPRLSCRDAPPRMLDVSVVYCKRKRNILWNVRVFRGIIEALKQQPRPI
jgi:hypothetical protein